MDSVMVNGQIMRRFLFYLPNIRTQINNTFGSTTTTTKNETFTRTLVN